MANTSLAHSSSLINPQPDIDQLISKALYHLEHHLRYQTHLELDSTPKIRNYIHLQLGLEEDEVFAVLFLTSHLQLIKFEKLFFGTHSRVEVYPRKIVKQALQHNAAKLVIAHNHPSQDYIPSCGDKYMTQKIKKILDIIDVELIDHIIVARHATYSFAERGLL